MWNLKASDPYWGSFVIQVKPYHVPAEQIERQLGEIETNLARLEKEGVALEKNLRSCEEGGDFLPDCSLGTNMHILLDSEIWL